MKKEIYLPYLSGKKVTVMGLGLLGRGIGDTAFLAKSGADILVTDKKSEVDLATSVDALKEYTNIAYRLGEHRLEDFENRDFIVKAAGVPYDSEYVAHARRSNVPVYMSAALVCSIGMKHCPDVVIVGVTGTRGKSTTTEMIAHILRSNNSRVHIGGNVRGVANLPLLDEIEDGDFLVLELDSWQLQGFRDLRISPHIAVFTTFMDDHMNYYKGDRELYFDDKAQIYRYQTDADVLIAGKDVAELIRAHDKDKEVVTGRLEHFDMLLIGEHNQALASLAYEVGVQCGLDDESILEGIKTFKPVSGRLEDMGIVRGVRVFNDNNATTGDATVTAINSIVETYNRKPILIVGGTDKGLAIDVLEQVIQENTKNVVYLSGTGTARMTLLKKYEFEDLKDCVEKAFEISSDGDIILFSPAFASFSKFFSNEYERNDMFVELILSRK
jgi:UDP-N-acetylmuramoylalanine--D-glutamate ligase